MPSEMESYVQHLEDLRGQVRELVAGLPAEALNWRPAAGEVNSPAVLVAHIAGAEHFLIAEVVGKEPATRNREAEFAMVAVDAEELVHLLDAASAETRQVLAALTPDDLDGERTMRGRDVPVRWCILHAIDHAALHLGQLQLTVQLGNERLKGVGN